MGSRDYRKRETKKPRKDGKKIESVVVPLTPAEVEVVRKRKKKEEEEAAE